MGFLMRKTQPRTLYIIAPSLLQCHRTAVAWGLEPMSMQYTRSITSAYHLRGVAAGTPFIAWAREHWADSDHGAELDRVVAIYQQLGRLRIAQEKDVAEHRLFADLPMAATAQQDARAAL